jgi:hypothetical protein
MFLAKPSSEEDHIDDQLYEFQSKHNYQFISFEVNEIISLSVSK